MNGPDDPERSATGACLGLLVSAVAGGLLWAALVVVLVVYC